VLAWISLGACLHTAVADEASVRRLLALEFAREASIILEGEPITLEAIRAATILAEEATALAPNDPARWRDRLAVAALADDEEQVALAVERLVDLDPDDETILLRHYGLEIDRKQIVEERIAAYEALLAPDLRERIGGHIASRLALDLAMLYRRRGDEYAFGTWLAEATALDPGHRAAAALAAGYFRASADDVFGEAELLTSLMLADPADVAAQIELGHLLLEHGAYDGAQRILRLATNPRMAGGIPSGSELFADLAIAQWGAGRDADALATIRRQQRDANELFRETTRREQPDLGPLELARLSAPISPTLATVRAAVHDRLRDDEAPTSLAAAVRSYDLAIGAATEGDGDHSAAVARFHMQKAWVLAWLGGEIDLIDESVQAADRLKPLNEEAKQRVAGWTAFRRGRWTDAVEHLEPLAAADPVARLGLALTQLAQGGKRRDAARNLLSIIREQPGSLMGVWSADLLFEMLGQRVPINDQAGRLDQLVASIPSSLDRFNEDPTLCFGLRVTPAKATFSPYEPIIVNVEITNNTQHPLSIGADGPLRPLVLLEISARVARARTVGDLPPIVVRIDQRVTLEPRQRLVVPVDLRRYRLGRVLNRLPLPGAILRVKAKSNVLATSVGALRPGPLGAEAEAPPFRVDGLRLDVKWIESAMADVIATERPRSIETMALLSHVADGERWAALPVQAQELLRDTIAALAEAYADLEPAGRAWMLATMSRGSHTESILAMARKSDDRLVKFAYLLFCLSGEDDPMLDAARRDTDPRVRELAEIGAELMRRAREQGRVASPDDE
jgi:tetratricopeptide (TPR) repeat protein